MPAPDKYPGLTRAGLGRPHGSINRATRAMKEFFTKFLESEEYRESLKRRILAGKAVPIEALLWDHIYGKVKARVDVSASVQRLEDQVHIYLPRKDSLDEASQPALPPGEPEDDDEGEAEVLDNA